jgi:hypothetical protein
MQPYSGRCVLLTLIALGCGLLIWHRVASQAVWVRPDEPTVATDAETELGAERSTDLASDLALMKETQRLKGESDPTQGPNPRCSTERAIDAASRVFNTIEIIGKSRADVVAVLGDPKSQNDSIYNFPFWPAPRGSLVYRFDDGARGWQFNVVFDKDGRVVEIQRNWIH